MKNEKKVPFPAPYCIFLRTYLLKMSCGKRRKWHFRDLQLKTFWEKCAQSPYFGVRSVL